MIKMLHLHLFAIPHTSSSRGNAGILPDAQRLFRIDIRSRFSRRSPGTTARRIDSRNPNHHNYEPFSLTPYK